MVATAAAVSAIEYATCAWQHGCGGGDNTLEAPYPRGQVALEHVPVKLDLHGVQRRGRYAGANDRAFTSALRHLERTGVKVASRVASFGCKHVHHRLATVHLTRQSTKFEV